MATTTPMPGNELSAKIAQAAASTPGELAVLDPATRRWSKRSWQEVHAKAQVIAEHALARMDDQVGVIGLVGDPSVELVAAVQAAWLAGTSVSIFPGPTRGADPEQWAQASLAKFASIGATIVYSHGQELDLLRRAEASPRVEDLVAAGSGSGSGSFIPVVGGDGETSAVLQSTAGSTGTPKTAAVSRRAVLANTGGLASRLAVTESDVMCSWLPLYHDMGLITLMFSMTAGMSLWLAPNTAFAASPLRWLDWLTESAATLTASPNFGYDIIGRFHSRIKDVDLGRLRVAISGGESIDCDGFQRFFEATAPFGCSPASAAPAYGLAETTCATTMPARGEGMRFDEVVVDVRGAGERPARRYALLGKAIDGMQVRITPSSSNEYEIKGREVGEVEVRGTSMMSGYLGDGPTKAEEWFATGDVGYLVDGELVVVGRSKELIVVAGRNIFPAEIERVVEKVAGVRGGGVAAVEIGERTARPGLAIALEYKGSDESAARGQVLERVASECGVVPAEVIFLPPGYLPRTTSGKLRRLAIKQHIEKTEGALR